MMLMVPICTRSFQKGPFQVIELCIFGTTWPSVKSAAGLHQELIKYAARAASLIMNDFQSILSLLRCVIKEAVTAEPHGDVWLG